MPQRPDFKRLPSLACLGTVKSISGPSASKTPGSPNYSLKVELEPLELGKPAKFYLTFNPRFFEPGFSVKSLNNSESFLYSKNISSSEGVAALIALFGAGWEEAERAFDEGMAALGAFDGETVGNYIRDFLTQLGPVEVGYVLKQQSEKTDTPVIDKETGEVKKTRAGNIIYEDRFTRFYEVGEFFIPDSRTIKYLLTRETKSAKPLRDKNGKPLVNGEGEPILGPATFELTFNTSRFVE